MYGIEVNIGELSLYTKDVEKTGSILKAIIIKWIKDLTYLESCNPDYQQGYQFGEVMLHDDGFIDITTLASKYFTGITPEEVKQAFIDLYHDGFIDIRFGENGEFLTKVLG